MDHKSTFILVQKLKKKVSKVSISLDSFSNSFKSVKEFSIAPYHEYADLAKVIFEMETAHILLNLAGAVWHIRRVKIRVLDQIILRTCFLCA